MRDFPWRAGALAPSIAFLLFVLGASSCPALAAAPVGCATPLPPHLPLSPIEQSDVWSPAGGDVAFTLHGDFASGAAPMVCFRWLTTSGAAQSFVASGYIRNQASARSGVREFSATVPDLGPAPDDVLRSALRTVPLVEVRVLMVDPATNAIVAADTTRMGITSAGIALAATGLATLLAFLALALIAPRRGTANWFLRVLAAKDGHASISQFQLLLWTFVVGASAVYVMLLSGELVEIKPHLLVLLGISGAANLGARVTAPPVMRAAGAAAMPSWSDLVMNDGQIDPTRVQMLFFTLITAAFVLVYIVSVYELPDIPDGFMLLMGVSNSLYVGAKVVAPGASPAAPGAG